jgi:hypothetical protein
VIHIRRARPQDANGMGLAHVAAWRSAYAGILPEGYLANLSALREAASYQRGIAGRQNGHAAFVAVVGEEDMPEGTRAPARSHRVSFQTCCDLVRECCRARSAR